MKRRAGAVVALLSMAIQLVAGGALSPLWASNGVFPVAGGSRAAGRAGVDAAICDDAYAMNTNPAGITQLYGLHADTSFGLFHVDALYRDPENAGAENVNRFFPITNGGIVFSPDFFDAKARIETMTFSEAELMGFDDEGEDESMWKKFEPAIPSPWRFGAGIFTQGGAGADFHEIKTRNYGPPDFPNGVTHRTGFALLSLAPTVAYEVDETFSVGAAINLNYGQIDLDMPFSQDVGILGGPNIPGLPSFVNFGESFRLIQDLFGDGRDEVNGVTKIKKATAWGWGFRVGALWKPVDEWSFGAWYASRTYMQDFEGDVHLDFDREIQNLPDFPFPNLFEAIIRGFLSGFTGNPVLSPIESDGRVIIRDFNFPERAGFGFAYRPDRDWLFAFDLKWHHWSQTFQKFTADIEELNSAELPLLVGATSIHAEMPLKWKDQWVFAGGIEHRWDDDLTLRCGANYAKNIIPPSTYLVIFPAITELSVSAGFSYRLAPNMVFDFAYEHAFENQIRAKDHWPLGLDYFGSEFKVSQDVVIAGIQYDF